MKKFKIPRSYKKRLKEVGKQHGYKGADDFGLHLVERGVLTYDFVDKNQKLEAQLEQVTEEQGYSSSTELVEHLLERGLDAYSEVEHDRVLILTKRDLPALLELLDVPFPALAVSAETGAGLEAIGEFLFDALEIVRVYTKTPGKRAENEKPFAVRRGQTVADVAVLVHKDIAQGLKYARLWGGGRFDAQQVGPQHEVKDGDVLELHSG